MSDKPHCDYCVHLPEDGPRDINDRCPECNRTRGEIEADKPWAGLSWNYRVVRQEDDYLAIRRVYYTNDEPKNTTKCLATFEEETLGELKESLQMAIDALEAPVLNLEDFGDNTEFIDAMVEEAEKALSENEE